MKRLSNKPGLQDVALTLRALPLLVRASYVLRRAPPSRALQWLGVAQDSPAPRARACDAGELALARRIGRAVQRAARALPWKCDCMPQAMVTCRLLQQARIGHVATIGGRLAGEGDTVAPGTFYAHAWVSVGGEVVVGQATSALHTPLAYFVPESGYAARSPS